MSLKYFYEICTLKTYTCSLCLPLIILLIIYYIGTIVFMINDNRNEFQRTARVICII